MNLLPPAPPVPRNKEAQATAYTNASFWSNWYEQLRSIVNKINQDLSSFVTLSMANTVGGYAAIDTAGRINVGVDTPGHVILDTTTNGLILKSPSGNYWRINVSDGGVISAANIGTTKP